MFGRVGIGAIAILLLVALGGSAYAQDGGADGSEAPSIEDGRDYYRVGFSELVDVDLPPEFRYIASTLPRLMAETFDGPLTHTYQEEERRAYAAMLLDEARVEARRELSTAVRNRDRLLFDTNVTAERLEQARASVEDARQRYDALVAADVSVVEVPQTKEIRFWDGRATGRLLAPVSLDPALQPIPEELQAVADAADLDLLVWGVIEEVQGYLSVQFFAYSPYGAEMPLILSTTALPSEINQETNLLADGIATLLLGRKWGSITVTTNVGGAAIYVNGALAGYGSAQVGLLPPGVVAVDVEAEGFRTVSRDVSVVESQTVAVGIDLEEIPRRTVRVESAPGGANVYVDSVWVGVTPLTVTVGPEPGVVRLRAEGYLESRFVLSSSSPDRIARVLLPASLDWAEEIRTARDGFYNSLSWFVLSIPVTMILNGVYENVYGAYPPDAGPEFSDFGRLGNIFYWSYWGGLLVNIGLFVNMGINLFEYLEVGEGPHNQ